MNQAFQQESEVGLGLIIVQQVVDTLVDSDSEGHLIKNTFLVQVTQTVRARVMRRILSLVGLELDGQ